MNKIILATLVMVAIANSERRKPVSLLVPDETKTKLMVDQRGMAALRKIGDTPVAVVTVIGRTHTGKSFSLNRILGVSHDVGFEVGHYDRPKTVGATIWPEAIPSRNPGCNFSYVIIDTEGIGTGVQTYDKALLTMATVLSSRLVYHLDKYVYFDDITKLYSIAQLASYYESRGMLGTEKVRGRLLPPITWVVQQYKFKHETDEKTARDVLFNVFMRELDNPTDDQHVGMFNRTVRIVKTAFPGHSIYLIPPATSGKVDDLLTDLWESQFTKEYISAMKLLGDEMLGCTSTVPRGLGLTGNDVAELVQKIIQPANLGVDYVGEKVSDIINRATATSVIEEMEKKMSSVLLPLDESELDSKLRSIRSASEDSLIANMSRVSNEDGSSGTARFLARPYLDDMGNRYSLLRSLVYEQNSAASDKACSRVADELAPSVSSTEAIKRFAGDVLAFDRECGRIFELYDIRAIGPRAGANRKELWNRAMSGRLAVASEGAPRRRMSWAVCSVALAVGCHALTGVASRIKSTGILIAAMSVVELGSTAIAIVAAWSVIGNPPINFDVISDFLTAVAFGVVSPTGATILATAIIASSIALLIFTVRNRSTVADSRKALSDRVSLTDGKKT